MDLNDLLSQYVGKGPQRLRVGSFTFNLEVLASEHDRKPEVTTTATIATPSADATETDCRGRRKRRPDPNSMSSRIINYYTEHGPGSVHTCAEALGITVKQARSLIQALISQGRLTTRSRGEYATPAQATDQTPPTDA